VWSRILAAAFDMSKLIQQWDEEDVAKFVADTLRSEQFRQHFVNACVNGKVLITLTDDDFKELGVANRFHRIRLVEDVRTLKSAATAAQASVSELSPASASVSASASASASAPASASASASVSASASASAHSSSVASSSTPAAAVSAHGGSGSAVPSSASKSHTPSKSKKPISDHLRFDDELKEKFEVIIKELHNAGFVHKHAQKH
jgi:hypothetical protein